MLGYIDLFEAPFNGRRRPVIFPGALFDEVRAWVNSTPDLVEQMGVLYVYSGVPVSGHVAFLHKHKAVGDPNPVGLSGEDLETIIAALKSVNLDSRNDCQAVLIHSHPSGYPTVTQGDRITIRNIANYAAGQDVSIDKHIVWPHGLKPRAYEALADIVEIPIRNNKDLSEAQLDVLPEFGWRKRALQAKG